jgi:hypothetical protein
MKIYYVPKKNMIIVAAALLLALAMLGWGMIGRQPAMTTSDVNEPIFQATAGPRPLP